MQAIARLALSRYVSIEFISRVIYRLEIQKRESNKEKEEIIVKITTATSMLIKYQSSSRAILTLMIT